MKRIIVYGLAMITCFGMATQPNVLAQDMVPQTENTILDNLTSRCDEIHGSLRRLHTSDALLRVNVGQTYNTISARLMARLNSRLALNRIDSRELVEISGNFDQQRSEFSSNYNEYESSLSSLIKIDCKSKPAEFYAQLITTRDLRLRLAETVKSMNASISDYRTAVEKVRTGLSGDQDEG